MAFVISKKRRIRGYFPGSLQSQLRHQRGHPIEISATPPPRGWSSRGRSGPGEFLPQLTQLRMTADPTTPSYAERVAFISRPLLP